MRSSRQLEVPIEAVVAAAAGASFFCLNAAPARGPLTFEPDLLVVNRYEYEVAGPPGACCDHVGSRGCRAARRRQEIARARPPRVRAVDGTAAGDAFCAALVVALLGGEDRADALRRACAAGALAASRAGAQPSLPTAAEVDALLAG